MPEPEKAREAPAFAYGWPQRMLPYPLWRWIFAPLRCKLWQHWTSNREWSYGDGVICWHCPGCQRVVVRTPLDDATGAQRDHVSEVIEEIEEHLKDEGQEWQR